MNIEANIKDSLSEPEFKLLTEVKRYNNITWEDNNLDEDIWLIILEGKEYLQSIIGSIDFDKSLRCRSLLKDYVRYVRNFSKEYFQENFQKDILREALLNAKCETSSV